jgi:curli production assembly/transport component CsgF
MMKKTTKQWGGSATRAVATALVALCATWLAPAAGATELVYVPTNPTFGGNPINASGLMAAAVAQNDFKAPEKTAAERFASSLQSSVLSRLTRNAMEKLFDADDNPVVDTKVEAGDFTVEFKVNETTNQLELVVTDASNGGATSIVIGN